MERLLGGEVLMHAEFLRTMEGAFNCSGLQLDALHAPRSG